MSWARKILRVDLTKGTCTAEPLNMAWAMEFLGQRGLATKYFTAEVDPGVDPLSPANKLIYATGPLTGTMASTAASGNALAAEITAKLASLSQGTQAFANAMQDVAAASEEQSASTQEIAAAANALVAAADRVSGAAGSLGASRE